MRLIKHLFLPDWLVRVRFKQRNMQQIESAIASSKKAHDGEIRFAVEASLSIRELLARRTARDRALEVFSSLRIWDTEHNNGVLIYFLLADKDFEIIADRGINTKVDASEWQDIAQIMEQHCRGGDFTGAVLFGIEAITRRRYRGRGSVTDTAASTWVKSHGPGFTPPSRAKSRNGAGVIRKRKSRSVKLSPPLRSLSIS